MDFRGTLRDLGFELDRETSGASHYVKRSTPYLTFWVQAHHDGTALFTWEFAIAEYVAARGMQVGSDEHLNTFLYPREDAPGPQDPVWLAAQIDRTEALLRDIRLLEG